MFSKKNFKFCLTTKQFSYLSQSILNAFWPREDGVSGLCSHMASLHDKALPAFVDGIVNCSQTLISQSVPEPMMPFPWQIHACFYCSAASGFKDHRHPLLEDYGLTSWQVFTVLHGATLFWNYFAICRHSSFQIGEPVPILTSEKLCLSKMLFIYPIMFLTSCK